MKKILAWLFFGTALLLHAEEILWRSEAGKDSAVISVTLEKEVYLYKDQTSVKAFSADGKEILPRSKPEVAEEYNGPGVFRWEFGKLPAEVQVKYQGCTKDGICFLPQEKKFVFEGKKEERSLENAKRNFPPYELIRTISGYRDKKEFLDFLRGKEQISVFVGKSIFMIFLLTLIGGFFLNFTPCILPMIPINLAIIGAKSGRRKMRLLRGILYGSGIAAAYGILGVIVILTGSTFGEFASSWIFNAAVGLIFILLGLSLFDLFLLDFSKYKTKFSFSKTRLTGVFAMGALSAVLAGACVAPVAVSALLQGGKMYQEGSFGGLFLPFVLGLGMALPWPVAAAGMTVIPKPGKWMNAVKYCFGIFIIATGGYYCWISYGIFRSDEAESVSGETQLVSAVSKSAATGKMVLIDFHAQWCKNCHAMDRTTLRSREVKEELKQFLLVKFDATKISSTEVKKVLKEFGVQGLPSYVILRGK